jgi:hypothetical protein
MDSSGMLLDSFFNHLSLLARFARMTGAQIGQPILTNVEDLLQAKAQGKVKLLLFA